MIEHAQTTLVTVDPAAAEDDESMLTLRMPVLEALTRIDEVSWILQGEGASGVDESSTIA